MVFGSDRSALSNLFSILNKTRHFLFSILNKSEAFPFTILNKRDAKRDPVLSRRSYPSERLREPSSSLPMVRHIWKMQPRARKKKPLSTSCTAASAS